MKILITGGHFSPALAVIEELGKDVEILVVGRKTAFEGDSTLSFEYQVCQKLGIPFREIRAGRFHRKLTRYSVSSMLKMPLGLSDAFRILYSIKPDVVLTFGGYLALPVAQAAFILRIPVVLHEQTQGAGLANKIISKFATKICISFESSRKYFPQSKIILTGNPIRKEISKITEKFNLEDVELLPIIYITGGSTGAHFLNSLMEKTIKQLLDHYVIIHQTGESMLTHDFEKLEQLKKTLPSLLQKRYFLRKYINPDEIGWVMKNADLIIGRSGINTVCELLALGKICLLIPLPHGQKNEQLENAKLIEKTGIGEYIEQEDVTPQIVLEKIENMLTNRKKYEEHKGDALKLIKLDAADKIIEVVKSINT